MIATDMPELALERRGSALTTSEDSVASTISLRRSSQVQRRVEHSAVVERKEGPIYGMNSRSPLKRPYLVARKRSNFHAGKPVEHVAVMALNQEHRLHVVQPVREPVRYGVCSNRSSASSSMLRCANVVVAKAV